MALAFPSFAMAQSQSNDEDERAQQATEVEAVVITGSRIRRTEFTSTQPVQIITQEQATLEGLADTAEILQSSTAAANAGQINNYFTGFVTTGGPGVNTISLRGLGAQRTLVLINGRRAGPAGVRGQVGPTDLNVIPGSQISRVEILTDGASSIYGSDAVAGVINIITRETLDGGQVELFYNQPFESGGEEMRFSGSFGRTFDRGYFSVGADYYERQPLFFGDRDEFRCPQDQVYRDANLSIRADVRDPATGEYKCNVVLNSILRTAVAINTGGLNRAGDFVPTPGLPAGGGFLGCDVAGWRHVAGGAGACSITAQSPSLRREAYLAYPLDNARYDGRTAISPVTRTSFTAFGGFDLTPNMELFGEVLLNRRESEQNSWRQLFPTVSPEHPTNPFGGACNGINPTLSCHWATPVALMPMNFDQTIDYARVVAGIRGTLNVRNGFDWELAFQRSESNGEYGGGFFYQDRVFAAEGYDAIFAGGARRAEFAATGCDSAALLPGSPACPTGGVNWFTRDFIVNGQLSPAEEAWLTGYEVGNTEYIHTYVEGVISGELFNLPAGALGAALGFQIRKEELDDQPGPEAARGNSWGLTSAGRTTGEDTIREAFLELEVPVVRNLPLMDSLTLNLSGRLSDYDSYGDNTTYKVGLNWQLTPAWRIRASQGTSFRAPALYELFLANQTSFLGQTGIDPCANTVAREADSNLNANCLAHGVPITYTGAGTSSATIVTGGGLGVLNPETAEANSLGLIWTPSFIDLSIALDYFKIEIEDQVQQFGSANIVNACYRSETFPNDPLCSLVTRDQNPNSTRFNQILQVNDSYVNVARQMSRGLDLTVRYEHQFAAGDLLLQARVTQILDWETQVFGNSVPTIQVGRIGQPEFVGNFSARFDRGDWTTFYSVDWVGETSNADFLNPPNTGVYLGEPVFFKRFTDDWFMHTASVRRRFDEWTLQLGIQNIFDERAPWTSASGGGRGAGNVPLTSQYDYLGRRAFINISKTF